MENGKTCTNQDSNNEFDRQIPIEFMALVNPAAGYPSRSIKTDDSSALLLGRKVSPTSSRM